MESVSVKEVEIPITVENITYKTVKVPLHIPKEITRYVKVPLRKEIVRFQPRDETKLNNDDLISTTASSNANPLNTERKIEHTKDEVITFNDVQQLEVIGEDVTAELFEEGEEEEVECVSYEPEIYLVPIYIPKLVCNKLSVKERIGNNLKLVKNLRQQFWSTLILKMNQHLKEDLDLSEDQILADAPPPPSDEHPLPGGFSYQIRDSRRIPQDVLEQFSQNATRTLLNPRISQLTEQHEQQEQNEQPNQTFEERAIEEESVEASEKSALTGPRFCHGRVASAFKFSPSRLLCSCGMGAPGGRFATNMVTPNTANESIINSVVVSRGVTMNHDDCCHPHDHLAHLEIVPPCPCEKNMMNEDLADVQSSVTQSTRSSTVGTSHHSRKSMVKQTPFWRKWQCCNTLDRRGRHQSVVSVVDDRMSVLLAEVAAVEGSRAASALVSSRSSTVSSSGVSQRMSTVGSRSSGRTSASMMSSLTVKSVVTPATRSMRLCCMH